MSFKPIFAIVIVGLFWGCASKEDEQLMSDFNQKVPQFQQIQQTEQATIVQNGRVVGLINALYLYKKSTVNKANKYEKFIIGIYSDDDMAPIVMLNGKDAINITKMESNDPKLEGIPLKTRWNRYYMASFLSDDSKRLILKVSLGALGDKELVFSKAAKYVDTQKEF